jgi:hypothetical protein
MFTKIFSRIFDSSIAEDPHIRHMFMDLLVLADQDGIVDMTPGAIAARTRLPKDDVQRWIEALEAPDPESRSPEEDGRRLIKLDPSRPWGWRIVNFRRYRESASREMLRMSEANRKRAARQKWPQQKPPPHTPPQRRQEAEAEAERESDMSQVCPDMSGTNPDASGTCPGQVQGTHTDSSWPVLSEVLQRAELRGIPKDCAEKWWHEHDARGGCDRHGQPLKRWESALLAFAASWRAVDAQRKARNTNQPQTAREPIDWSKGFFGNEKTQL